MHVNKTIIWNETTDKVRSHYEVNKNGSLWLFPILKKNKIKILVYSGDTDAEVPELDTVQNLKSLKFNVLEWWRPWFITEAQIGGYVSVYDGFTFSTVRGAGHMAPESKREAGFYMFSHFIKGEKF